MIEPSSVGTNRAGIAEERVGRRSMMQIVIGVAVRCGSTRARGHRIERDFVLDL